MDLGFACGDPSYGELAAMAISSVLALRVLWSGRTLLRLLRASLVPCLGAVWLSRRADRCPLLTTSRGLAEGSVVRLSGVVVGEGVGRTRLKGRPAVAWSFDIRGEVGDAIDGGTEALDFLVRLDDGELVRVRAGQAAASGALRVLGGASEAWTHSPLRAAEAYFRESAVAPGDRVEIVGIVGREIDGSVAPRAPRRLPTIWTVAASAHAPLMVR